MFIPISFFFILLTTKIESQNTTAQFSIFPVNTDIGSCTCDLTASKCDISCCCDPDCSAGDQEVFDCSSRANQYTNSTPVISTVQPSCFKNISIFKSNSPYIIQKMGELVCVDYARYQGSQYYQQPQVQTLDPNAFTQAINTEYSVLALPTLPTNLTNYQVGTGILTYNTVSNVSSYYSLPVKLFNNHLCAGSQSITYMNDFTSTCSQLVSNSLCTGVLNPLTYLNPLCLIQSPSNLVASSSHICDNTSASNATFLSPTCSGALSSLTVNVFYSNPTGIVGVNLTYSIGNASTSVPFEQTFTVKFIESGSSSSSSSNATRNPGYLPGATMTAGIVNGSTLNTISSSLFTILKPLSDGTCGGVSADRTPIRFGENVRSTCKYSVSTTETICPALNTLLMPINSINLYIAAYSNSDRSNVTTDWLPVISCTSDVGSPNNRQCQTGVILNSTSVSSCYVRLDIQIAYTNIGSIANPQSVLSAVIFNYQQLSLTSINTSPTLLVMTSVTFQDISNAPIVEQGQIPTPNTRVPADFFYPFSVSQGTKFMTFSSFSYLLISIIFILM